MSRRVALFIAVLLASCGAEPVTQEALPRDLASARALKPGDLTSLGLPEPFGRVLPKGWQTPVAAVVLRWTEGDVAHEDLRGLQFAVAPDAVDLTVRGLRRVLERGGTKAVVFHAPAANDARRVCVLSRDAHEADALREAGHTLTDPEDLAGTLEAWRESTGVRLLGASADDVLLDVPRLPDEAGEALAAALAELMPDPDAAFTQILQDVETGRVRLSAAR